MTGSSESQRLDEGDPKLKEAAEWFARLANERTSEADCEAYRAWRSASSEDARAYDEIASAWDSTARFADAPSIMEMRLAALADTAPRPIWRRYAAIAAVLAMAVLGLASLTMVQADRPGFANSRQPAAQIAQASGTKADMESAEGAPSQMVFSSAYSTKVGEMAEFALPDGSTIALNTGSEVLVNYSAARRDLTLVQGEAVFTVAKDASRPFTVESGTNRVVALGTVFAVRLEGDEAHVTLLEGRVRVDRSEVSGAPASASLVAGEQLRIVPNRAFAISKAEVSRAISWREGRLVFDQTPLREVLREFNRYSDEKLVLRDAALGDFLVNGTFRIRSSDHFAATLEAGFPLTVRPRSDGKILEIHGTREFDQ